MIAGRAGPPPDALRQLMSQGGGPPGMPPGGAPPGAPGQVAGPGAAPIGAPQEAAGQKMSAMPKVTIAMKVLMSALPDLGVMSEEGGVVYEVLQKLQKTFGKQEGEELMPAELAMMNQGMQPPPELAHMARGGAGGQPQPGGMPGM